jgi:cobalt transporter subunit CbtA
MFRRIFGTALGAGVAVGLIVALIQHVTLTPMILTAETYEHAASPAHEHSDADTPAVRAITNANSLLDSLVSGANAHEIATVSPEPAAPFLRTAWTWVATVLTSVGFALLLSGSFAVSGKQVNAREGLLWGLAGFAAFALAPAFGLPPELPGSAAAELASRQIWWVSTVAATVAALALWAFGRATWTVPVAVALLVAPHVIGAPHPHSGVGVVPPELAAGFAARSLGVNAILWALLGLAAGTLYERLGRARTI